MSTDLEQLIAKWRDIVAIIGVDFPQTDTSLQACFMRNRAYDIDVCADQLEALLAAQPSPTIDCPLCGVTVQQIASATLSLALWQHVNWVCNAKGAQPSPRHDEDNRECGRCGHTALWHSNFGKGECQVRVGCACHEFLEAPPSPRQEPRGWQPIETADQRASVLGGALHEIYGWLWDRAEYHKFPALKKEEWICRNGMTPTHFLPLPPAPSEARTAAEPAQLPPIRIIREGSTGPSTPEQVTDRRPEYE